MIHESIQPEPLAILKIIKTSTWHHLSTWQHGESDSAEWMPPPFGTFKVNFDVAIRPTFVVIAATLRDHSGNFLAVNYLKLSSTDANLGEAHATLLAVRLAASFGCSPLIIEGDSMLTILAIKDF